MRYLFILLFAVSTICYGQKSSYSSKSKKAIKYYEEATLNIKRRQFPEAIQKLNKAVEKDKDFIEAHLKLAFCYDIFRNMKLQEYHLEEVVRIAPDPKRIKNVYYSLGRVYFKQGKYQQANEALGKLKSMGIENEKIKQDVEVLEKNINFALENLVKKVDIDPHPMPDIINAFPLQYFPALTADEEIIIYTVRHGDAFYEDEDIYISEKDPDGNWQTPVSISPNINSEFNEGTCSISADGRTLIFTNCQGRKGVGRCDLYISYKEGVEWSVPENLGREVNSRSWDSQPSLSADGRQLFFISDRAGGVGKKDIWMSEKDREGNWTQARNLGPGVNTPEDEVSPFIHVNGTTLFFASEGYPGFGGFDIYSTEKTDTSWSEPKNLGYPINTHEDQLSLFVSTSGERGYYSFEKINSEGRKESFLYQFEFPASAVMEHRSTFLKGHVYDEETKEPINSTIELYTLGEDKPLSIFRSDPVSGEYFSILNEGGQYALFIESEGYLFESQTFNLESGKLLKPVYRDIFLKPLKTGISTRLNNIFFEHDSYELSDASITELRKIVWFFDDNPSIKVEISGHTDDNGASDYNQKLSEQRAKAVYEFLRSEGVDQQNLTYKGYGESKPVAPNTSDENRQLNRRIEFTLIK